ncbi:MAG: putative porin [Planctomycetota bacterium]|nr:putative porin [Planctomycetota bacterium]
MNKWILITAVGVFLLTCVESNAQGAKEDEVKAPMTAPVMDKKEEKKEEKKPWTDNITLLGDFRLRHETIKEENVTERNRERIRVRFGAEAKLNDEFKLTLRLASGSSDPVSTNQTLTGGFTRKDINIDLAFFEWNPIDKKLSFLGGKMKNPLLIPGKSDLIWDGDLSPEGIAVKYTVSAKTVEPFITVAGFSVEERATAPDAWLFAGQGGLTLKFNEDTNLKFGGGYFNYGRTKGYQPFYLTTNGFGNTLVGGRYANDYNEVEWFIEFKFKTGKIPFILFADYVENNGASEDNTGYLFGFSIGKNKSPGDWSISYDYRRLEKDAVIGAFTDSDSWNGGTNGEGHRFSFEIVVAKNVSLGTTMFLNKKDLDNKTDFKRFQFDLVLKF